MKDYNFKQSAAIVGVGCGLLLIGLYLFTPFFVGSRGSKERSTQLEETELANAITQYTTVFQQYPAGENADVIKMLAGNNPQRMRFLNLGADSTNKDGQLIDIWGTPYKISFNSTNNFTISSAGGNQVFGDIDDIIFDSSSNSFSKP